MRRTRRVTALTCFVLAIAGPAAQAENGADPFAKVAPSIARMNFSGFRTMGHCTAVQVGQRAVLSAGGCIKAGSFDQLHFLFGYDRQKWSAHRSGRKAFNDPADSALKLLCLDAALPEMRFVAPAEPVARGERVIVAGYGAPRSHKVTFQGCSVTGLRGQSGFMLGCGLSQGNAGAAVFELDSGEARLLGIVTAGNASSTLVLTWTGQEPDQLCPADPGSVASESNG